MDIEMLSGTRGRKMSFATSPNSVASSHDFSFSGNLSASGSPRSSAPILPSLASEMQQAGRPWGTPPSRPFGGRDLDSPVNGVFSRLNMSPEKQENDMNQGEAKEVHDDDSSEKSGTVTSKLSEDENDDDSNAKVFGRQLTVANIASDRETMSAHLDYLQGANFSLLHHDWLRSGNLRGNLVDSVPFSVLRDVMVGMISHRPILLLLGDKVVGAKEAGENLRRVLALLIGDIDLVALNLNDESSVGSVSNAVFGERRSVKRDTLLIISSGSVLKKNVEQCLVELFRSKKLQTSGIDREFRGNLWMIFVASSLESGLSMWVKKECLLSSLLSFGKPVGGLNPEVDSVWIGKHRVMWKAAHHDLDLARWCRDLVSIMRSSPYLLTHLIVPALADNIILVAKCHALLHGKTFVSSSEVRGCFFETIRHQLVARPGSPYTVFELVNAATKRLTFPT